MSTLRVTVLALSVGLAACGAKTMNISASGRGGVPPLPPGVNVPKWDHYCAFYAGGEGGETEFAAMLHDASESSWEMVSAAPLGNSVLLCFKRPAVTPADSSDVTPPSLVP